ncbi:hypothetical protein GCM10009554_20440 [Kribbella koreensis]|uniref:Uncharacterized protein n=1 Tax=Kribbella koreensis TaxID=57909 RepID=A0ABP4AE71_9ACTN
MPSATNSAVTPGATSHGTDTTTKSGRPAASNEPTDRYAGTPHRPSTSSPRDAVRVTTPLTANREGITSANRRKNSLRHPLPTTAYRPGCSDMPQVSRPVIS